MKRPLRSVLIGDCDYYPSEFIFGVAQGMTLFGHWHTTINLRHSVEVIEKRMNEIQPDILWGHMLLWAPREAPPIPLLLSLCSRWRARGTKVLLHDGDARAETRFPYNISGAVDGVLCNHTQDRSVWGVPQLHWPYFAFNQPSRASLTAEFQCDLAFAGRLSFEGIYAGRTRLVADLKSRLGEQMKLFSAGDGNFTLFRTPEVAASAGAILGYGRPEAKGWMDVRCFQYPGAGGVLLYDGPTFGLLEPEVHYLPYESGNVESVVAATYRAQQVGDGIRDEAFRHVQSFHSSVPRIREALAFVGKRIE